MARKDLVMTRFNIPDILSYDKDKKTNRND
jgi:hypothetical protein